MNILNLNPNNKDVIEIVDQKQQEKELKLVDSQRPQRGHTLFKFDIKTRKVEKAKFEEVDIDFKNAQKGDMSSKRTVMVEEGCIYRSALNVKNFIKILKRDFEIILEN